MRDFCRFGRLEAHLAHDFPGRRTGGLTCAILALGIAACGDLDDPGAPGIDCNLERTPPRVAFLAPAANATVSRSVQLRVNATDECGITELRFLIGGDTLARLASWVAQPGTNTFTYTFDWYSPSVPNGRVTVTAEADDYAAASSAGPPAPNTGVETRQFTVMNP